VSVAMLPLKAAWAKTAAQAATATAASAAPTSSVALSAGTRALVRGVAVAAENPSRQPFTAFSRSPRRPYSCLLVRSN
jgi:hypothetical protein